MMVFVLPWEMTNSVYWRTFRCNFLSQACMIIPSLTHPPIHCIWDITYNKAEIAILFEQLMCTVLRMSRCCSIDCDGSGRVSILVSVYNLPVEISEVIPDYSRSCIVVMIHWHIGCIIVVIIFVKLYNKITICMYINSSHILTVNSWWDTRSFLTR